MWQFLLFFISLYYLITRGVPYIVSQFIVLRYSTKIKIGRISLFRISFENVSIQKGNITIRVDSVGAVSSLFSHGERKILSLKLHDVRIEKTVNHPTETPSSSEHKISSGHSTPSSKNADGDSEDWSAFDSLLPEPKQFTVSPSVVTLAQFFGLRVIGISALWLQDGWPVCLAEADRLDVEAATLNQTNVAVTISCTRCQFKMLRQPEGKSKKSSFDNLCKESSKHEKVKETIPTLSVESIGDTSATKVATNTSQMSSNGKPRTMLSSVVASICGSGELPHNQDRRSSSSSLQHPALLECSLSFKVYGELAAENSASMEVVEFDLKDLSITARDHLGQFLQEQILKKSPTATSSSFSKSNKDISASIESLPPFVAAYPVIARKLAKYWLLVPQDSRLSIQNGSFNLLSSGLGRCNVSADLSNLDWCLAVPRSPHTLDSAPFMLPIFSCSFILEDANLSTTYNSALVLSSIRLDISHRERNIHLEGEVESFMYWFDHRDLTAFAPLIQEFMLIRTAKQENQKASPSAGHGKSGLLKNSFTTLECVVRLQSLGIGLQLPTGPALYMLLYHSYLDSVRGTLLIEGFTTRLSKECCCVRPCKLSYCYCNDGFICTTERCLARRNSASSAEEFRKNSCTDYCKYDSNGFLIPEPDSGCDHRRRSASNHSLLEDVTSNFLGELGKQMYMTGIGRDTSGNIFANDGAGDAGDSISLSKPFDDLKLLATQRDESLRKQHIWGSPLSIGVCHIKVPRDQSHITDSTCFDDITDACSIGSGFGHGAYSRRSLARSSTAQRRLRSTGDYLSLRSSNSSHSSCNMHFSNSCRDDVDIEAEALKKNSIKSRSTKVELDDLQAEWSPTLANLICAMGSYIETLKDIFNWKAEKRKISSEGGSEVKSRSAVLEHLELECYNIDVFAHTQHDVSLSLRCDTIKTLQRRTAMLYGISMRMFAPTPSRHNCVLSTQVTHGTEVGSLSQVSVVTLATGEILLEIFDLAHIQWCSELHLTVLAAGSDIFNTAVKFKPTPPEGGDEEAAPVRKAPLQLQLVAKGTITLGVRTSPQTELVLKLIGFTFLTARGLTSLQVSELKLSMDEHQIMQMMQCKLASSFNSSELRKEREAFPELSQMINKAWKLTVTEWLINFPYQYNFTFAFHEKVISLAKWLKVIHQKVKDNLLLSKASTGSDNKTDTSLPPDIILSIKLWKVTVEDDPFEVKLRYNYELMEDEYHESCKRTKAFNARINEIQRSGAFLSPHKLQELHASLKEKDSETYIKRSKQMYSSTPVRSDVFTWVVEDALIFALADPTMDGRDNAIRHLEEIDTATSLPVVTGRGPQFSSLWCRLVSASLGVWRFVLRDYPQPLMEVTALECWGRLVGAEHQSSNRGERTVVLPLAEPWHDGAVKRSLAPRKYYHDFSWEAKSFTIAYGPCWEPAMSQFNIAMSLITSRAVDPSLPLPWWDKIRLLLHGRLLLLTDTFTLKLHASLDPYNTTEEMELTWTGLALDWTNARLHFAGDLVVSVRTASKYDDARLLSLSNLRLTIKLQWVCLGDPDDHHAVMLCAPDKLPEYSSNQEHDSYRAFRSRNLDINISLETKTLIKNNVKVNSEIEMLFYGSTLRWFENLKFILSGVSRPVKRGKVFGNTGPRKLQLSRHYRRIHLALTLQRFDVRYWMSVGVKKGFHLSGERLSLSSEHALTLVPRNSGLIQRSLSRWSIIYLNSELSQAQIWLQSALTATPNQESSPSASPKPDKSSKTTTLDHHSSRPHNSSDQDSFASNIADKHDYSGSLSASSSTGAACDGCSVASEHCKTHGSGAAPAQVEKFYFIQVSKVAYMRETLTADHPYINTGGAAESPNHRLVVYHLKGAWTTNNRDIVLALYDSWNKTQLLKHNLSPEVLKSVPREGSPRGGGGSDAAGEAAMGAAGRSSAAARAGMASPMQPPTGLEATPSPMSRLQSGSGAELLHQLIKEADNNYVAYSEDCSNTTDQPRDTSLLQGVTDCITDDVVCKRWLIELVNSQVLLKGCDTQGYVIISAAKSQVTQRVHRPVWRQQTLNSKTTWCGSLECMQYYATVSPSHKEMQMDNILWLTVANIEERADTRQQPMDLTDIVGSSQSAGGIVTDTVGAPALDNTGCTASQDMQLQRIVSRCRCEFYYVCYGELGVEPELLGEVQPPPPSTDELWGDHRDPTDTFTLMHYDLCISTNSLQYNMVVDILNKLLLYVDPVKKAASSDLARMRFKLQLSSGDDQKKPIVKLQNQLRYKMSQLRTLEKDVYLVQRALDRDDIVGGPTEQLLVEKAALIAQVSHCKERLNTLSQELAIRVHLYNETRLRANHKISAAQGDKVTSIRINEVFFRKAQWRLTEADGQLGIAEVALSNFIYTKKTNSDDSGEHLLELGYVNMKNLLPNQVYTDVLAPTTLTSSCPLDRQKTLRIFCREKPPCGGIAVIDHFEINVVPLDISLTFQFYKTILKFCFPNNAGVDDQSVSGAAGGGKRQGMRRVAASKHATKDTHFYVQLQKDDVEIMKQRAEQNKMFVYVKIPELKVRLSYKGIKEKNLTDVTNFRLVVPSFECHNVTWTWLDFLNAVKENCKSALVPQLIKIKLNVGHKTTDAATELDEEEKARLLLGDRLAPPSARNTKKTLFKFKR